MELNKVTVTNIQTGPSAFQFKLENQYGLPLLAYGSLRQSDNRADDIFKASPLACRLYTEYGNALPVPYCSARPGQRALSCLRGFHFMRKSIGVRFSLDELCLTRTSMFSMASLPPSNLSKIGCKVIDRAGPSVRSSRAGVSFLQCCLPSRNSKSRQSIDGALWVGVILSI